MSEFSIPALTIFLGDQSESITLPVVTDSQSLTLGNQDGVSFCGERGYEIIDPDSFSSFLTYDDSANSLIIDPQSEADEGLHLIQVKVFLLALGFMNNKKHIRF